MRALALVVHWVSFSIWLGAQMTFMVFGPAAKRMSLESWANTWITLARVQRMLVAPCAAAATVTGVILTMALAQAHVDLGSTWLLVMQSFGLAAGILALTIVTPLANRMAFLASRSLEQGAKDEMAERVRVRLALTGTLSGVFILVALFFAALKPGH